LPYIETGGQGAGTSLR